MFLRFFAVAVVSPHTFHLRPHHPVSFDNVMFMHLVSLGGCTLRELGDHLTYLKKTR